MPVYNVEQYIEASLESVLDQTVKDYELIILDDCSTDDTLRIINKYAKKDGRIVVVPAESRTGLVENLNKGISLARGKYIARMDGDDISMPIRFERQIKFLEKYNLDLVGCQCIYFQNNMQVIKKINYPCSHKLCAEFLKQATAMAHPSWLGKREIFIQLGYREIRACEDYDFLCRAILNGKHIGNIPERLFKYRCNFSGISSLAAEEQAVTTQYLALNYRKNKSITIENYKNWHESVEYKELIMKESALCNFLHMAKKKGQIEERIPYMVKVVRNSVWWKKKIRRLRNRIILIIDLLDRSVRKTYCK